MFEKFKRKKRFSATRQRSKKSIWDAVHKLNMNLTTHEIANTQAQLTNLGVALPDGNITGSAVRGHNGVDLSHGLKVILFKSDVALYNEPRKMHIDMRETIEFGNPEVQDTLRAIMTNELSDHNERFMVEDLIFTVRPGDLEDVRKQVEQLVADMNEEARGPIGNADQYRIAPQAVTDINQGPNGARVIKFKIVRTEELLESVMTVDQLRIGLGKLPNETTGSTEYKNLINALAMHNQHPANIDMQNTLFQAATAYQSKHRKKKSDKQNGVDRLLNQLRDIDTIRSLNPVSTVDAMIGRRLGTGAKGDVFSKRFLVNRDGFPIPPLEFEAAIKLNSIKASDPARINGIPIDNPQESERAVTAYEVDRVIGLNIIPKTIFIKDVDQHGVEKLGQGLEVVQGRVGQKMIRTGVLSPDDILNRIESPEFYPPELNEYTRDIHGKIISGFKKEPRQINIDLDNPLLQKGLANLQLFDNIIGAPDRHPGNFIYETDGPPNHNIVGVKGIDNDDTFGATWVLDQSKTPGIPPLVDFDAAIRVLSINAVDFNAALRHLPIAAQDAATIRLASVQNEVRSRLLNGGIAASVAITQEQRNLLTNIPNNPNLSITQDQANAIVPLTWGTAAVTDLNRSESTLFGKKTVSYHGDLVVNPEANRIDPDFRSEFDD